MSSAHRRPPYVGDEPTVLRGFLGHYRATLLRQTEGLDGEQLQRTLPPSPMTLGGMLKHMAYVEDWWFGTNLAGRPPSAPWDSVDWDADDDWDWHSASGAGPAELRELFDRFVETSDAVVGAAPSLDDLAVRRTRRTGEEVSLRWIVVHMIEEYARHNGHADLIRESIDGSTGA